MRARAGLLAAVAFVGLVSFATYAPRLGHPFPSMIDDWNAIASAPEQLREVLRLGNPEEERYRPGFVMWNALQWHTLDAPRGFVGPQVWGVLRWGVLVLGMTLLAATLVPGPRNGSPWARWLLVAGAALLVVTPASIAVDVARFGPQEPLLVGCMALGASLLVHASDRLLEPRPAGASVVLAAAAGLAAWAFGVLQKETSVCVLLVAPFLVPTLRAQRERWERLEHGRRRALALVAGGVLLPFVPVVARMLELAITGRRVYEDVAAAKSFGARLSDQLGEASEVLHTRVVTLVIVAALALVVLRTLRLGVDWLSIGLIVSAFAFVVLAAQAGVVTSRYYLPALALLTLAVARLGAPFGHEATVALGVALLAGALWQARDARAYVARWVEGEEEHETLVREAAARAAGGCEVDVIGLNVELVRATPVLMPLADEPPRGCVRGERYLVVIDPGGPGTETPPDDPVLSSCAPEPEPAWSSTVGKILRCTP